MKDTLICTVGTSLLEGNLSRLSEHTSYKPSNWQAIKIHYEGLNWPQLAAELIRVDPDSRICGAEINTIQEAKNKKWINLENLVLLVSDTEAGRNTGLLLKHYFSKRYDLGLKQIEYCIINDLQDNEPKKFKTKGLRNLVRIIGNYVQRFGKERIVIDATGGYKAQIAVAVIMGQALDIPVYYKHERFAETIDFPSLPIALDYDLLGRNAGVLSRLEKGDFFEENDIQNFDQKLRVFLSETEIEGRLFFELNPIGQLYLTSFHLRNPKAHKLIPLTEIERKQPTFRDDHYPLGFKEFVNKIWLENDWIKTCYSKSYHGQKSIKGVSFNVKPLKEKHNGLIGTYQDRNNFGGRFEIILSDQGIESLNWAALKLNQDYGVQTTESN